MLDQYKAAEASNSLMLSTAIVLIILITVLVVVIRNSKTGSEKDETPQEIQVEIIKFPDGKYGIRKGNLYKCYRIKESNESLSKDLVPRKYKEFFWKKLTDIEYDNRIMSCNNLTLRFQYSSIEKAKIDANAGSFLYLSSRIEQEIQVVEIIYKHSNLLRPIQEPNNLVKPV